MGIEPKTQHLENCLRILGWYLHEDETVIDELLDPNVRLRNWFEPFTKELNANLISIESRQGKIDLIKHYMHEFWELQGFYKDNEDILFKGILGNYSSNEYEHEWKGKRRKLDKFENYVVNNYDLFAILFNEIQIVCFKYQIDFLVLCEELEFDTSLIDLDIIHFPLKKSSVSKEGQPQSKGKSVQTLKSFKDIFQEVEWKKYIEVFQKCEPPLIDKQWNYIGGARWHKGVICSWIKHLQSKSIIKQSINRSQLATVCNNEFKYFDLGKDGKTFDNYSQLFEEKFRSQFIKLSE